MNLSTTTTEIPLFRFGRGPEPITIIAGGLIFDTGEAERSFLYRCQDRFIAYAALLGWQPLLLALDEPHVDRYRRHISVLKERLARISACTGAFPMAELLEPLFVILDVQSMEVRLSQRFISRLSEPRIQHNLRSGVAINQISPTYAQILREVSKHLVNEGLPVDWELDRMDAAAEQVMTYQDKALFHDVFQDQLKGSPLDVPTAVLSETEFNDLETWAQLERAYLCRTGLTLPEQVFVKTSRNTSGNLSMIISRQSFEASRHKLLETLRRESSSEPGDLETMAQAVWADIALNAPIHPHGFTERDLHVWMHEQASKREGIRILVQPRLSAPEGQLAGYGMSYSVGRGGTGALNPTAQIYSDAERKHFLGSFVGPEIQESLTPDTQTLCLDLALTAEAKGYVGPISFDLLKDDISQPRFIGDCNPRLTGAFPTLAVAQATRQLSGAPSVLSTGYRGAFVLPDLDQALGALSDAGLLYDAETGQGLVILPNMSSQNGYDLHVVGYSMDVATALIESGKIQMALSVETLPLHL